MSMQLFINSIRNSTIAITKIFKESITIITLIIQTRRRVIIVTSLIVGALIPALMFWTEHIVGVDEVEVLLGFRAGIARMSNITIDFASHVGIHGFECLLGTHLLILFYSLCEQIYLSYKHVNFFN